MHTLFLPHSNAELGEDVHLDHVIVGGGVHLPAGVHLSGPCFVFRKDLKLSNLDDTIWVQSSATTPHSNCNYVCLEAKTDVSAETLQAIKLDLFPNVEYLSAVKVSLFGVQVDRGNVVS